jgi:hypothetical protein
MPENRLNDVLDKLEKAVNLENGGMVSEIDGAISKVVEFNDPSSIGPLLCMLRDDALFDEGMYSLIHAAEEFDDDIYIREFLLVLPLIRHKAPAWASVVLMRILNSSHARDCLTRKVRGADLETKESLSWLLEKINGESPEFLAKTVAVMVAARN